MRIQTKQTEIQDSNKRPGAPTKHNWVVESDDGKKALHDLYFETGSLPSQQPKVKAKEPEKGKPSEDSAPTASAFRTENEAPANHSIVEFSRNSWVKPAVYFTLAAFLGFGAYRVMMRLEISPSKPATHHIKSPVIREALEKRQAADPIPQNGSSLGSMGSLSVTPSVIVAQYLPGQSTSQTLTVDNQTPVPVTYELEAEDLAIQGGHLILVAAGDSSNSVAATAVFSQRYLRVEPMAKATVQVTLSWPPTTSVQGIVLQLRNTDDSRLGGTGIITTSLGTLITFGGRQYTGEKHNESPTDVQPLEGQSLTISQWSPQNGSNPPDAGTSNNSKSIKTPNLASLGGTQ